MFTQKPANSVAVLFMNISLYKFLRLVSPLELLFYHGHVTRLQDFTAHTEQKLALFRLTRPQLSLIISIWRGRLEQAL